MIDKENYFKGFKPSFNQERYEELMKQTPTNFMTEYGNVNADKHLVKSILGGCKLLSKEFDRNHIYYGGEGGGKSHTVFQHTYVWWWCLNELGMINYDFSMDLIYGKVSDIMKSFDEYAEIPYMIFTLDESDELNRKNWNSPLVKQFLSKLRRERKNLRIVNMILPALEEMLPAIALSRTNWIVEINVKLDSKLNPIRGRYSLMNIPVGDEFFSPIRQDFISKKEIKSYLNARFYDKDKLFEKLPFKLLSFTGHTNSTFVFDKKEYKKWAIEVNKHNPEDDLSDLDKKRIQQRDKLIVYLRKELGVKPGIISSVCNLSTTMIGDIVRKSTTN